MHALLVLILLLQTSTVAPSHPKEPIDKNISTDLPKGASKHKAHNKSSPVVTGNTPNNKENSAAQTANDEQQPYGITYRIETTPQTTEGRWFKGYVIATVFIALLNIGTLVVIWLQFRHMRLEQRAWVFINPPHIDGLDSSESNQLEVTITIGNSGHTPAMRVARFIGIEFVERDKVPVFNFKATESANFVVFPGGEISAHHDKDCTDDIRSRIASGDVKVWVYGKIIYKDVFKRWHWTKFCFAMNVSEKRRSFKAHTEHNEIDDEQKKNFWSRVTNPF